MRGRSECSLNTLALAAPDWLRPHLGSAWADRYGPRMDEYRSPKGQAEREELADQVGTDGFRLLGAIHAPEAPDWLRGLPAAEALRRVWLQQHYAPDGEGTAHWRRPAALPPSARMINSPHDLEARSSYKRSTAWVGYQVQRTETCDPETPT